MDNADGGVPPGECGPAPGGARLPPGAGRGGAATSSRQAHASLCVPPPRPPPPPSAHPRRASRVSCALHRRTPRVTRLDFSSPPRGMRVHLSVFTGCMRNVAPQRAIPRRRRCARPRLPRAHARRAPQSCAAFGVLPRGPGESSASAVLHASPSSPPLVAVVVTPPAALASLAEAGRISLPRRLPGACDAGRQHWSS